MCLAVAIYEFMELYHSSVKAAEFEDEQHADYSVNCKEDEGDYAE